MGVEHPLWGAPRIHGELLKLGSDVGQSSVAKYRVKRRVPPSQGWRTFLRNHVREQQDKEKERHLHQRAISISYVPRAT